MVVTDASGALIRNAPINVRNLQANESRTTQSNATAEYIVPVLLPGEHVATTHAAEFKRVVQFGAEGFNASGNINLAPPTGQLSTPQDGRIACAAPGRMIQFAPKCAF